MSRGLPSMTALLGLLAIAGYQNRDKLAEMLGRGTDAGPTGGAGEPNAGASGGQASGPGGAASAGTVLSGGLGELLERFRQSGQADTADSWVRTGPNKPVTPGQLEQAIGPEALQNLSRQTGLSREELLARLSRDLPDAVDRYTPQGRLPLADEA
ncbi:YidB family protein [Faunimonas sp. B44]|uniref:YidB family protein n=1 Tax=Faunimonas sp. B44 TaxID=3461493 RepID=UPI004044816E